MDGNSPSIVGAPAGCFSVAPRRYNDEESFMAWMQRSPPSNPVLHTTWPAINGFVLEEVPLYIENHEGLLAWHASLPEQHPSDDVAMFDYRDAAATPMDVEDSVVRGTYRQTTGYIDSNGTIVAYTEP